MLVPNFSLNKQFLDQILGVFGSNLPKQGTSTLYQKNYASYKKFSIFEIVFLPNLILKRQLWSFCSKRVEKCLDAKFCVDWSMKYWRVLQWLSLVINDRNFPSEKKLRGNKEDFPDYFFA